MPSLFRRDRQPEVMDQPGLSADEHSQALDGLRRINRLSRAFSALWREVQAVARRSGSQPVRVLDVACGGGDTTLRMAAQARRAGVRLEIHGCDISSTAIAYARQAAHAADSDEVRFFQRDIFAGPLPDDYDVIMCSLFLHHLDEGDAAALLRTMATATRSTVLVDDLVRSRLGYALAWFGCRVLSRSSVVHTDGPRSVQGAFSLPEVQALAEQAGLAGVRLQRHWPQRFLLSWEKG